MMPVQQQAKPLAAFSSASFFLFVLLLTAANLRAPITAVGPVLQDIRQTFGLSASEAGLFNFIPLMLFALLAPPPPGWEIGSGWNAVCGAHCA